MATQIKRETAELIYKFLRLRNPIVSGTIAAQNADINGTPQVQVSQAGQTFPAMFPPPRDVTVGGNVWVTRTRPPNRGGTGVVLWTNYQGGGGLGTGGLGTGPLGI
jgi:hypothetical protein